MPSPPIPAGTDMHHPHDLPSLPFELHLEIFVRLPPTALFLLRRVSKSWNSMLTNPHLTTTINNHHLPFLTSAPDLTSRLKRRMRLRKNKPVWVQPLHVALPWVNIYPLGTGAALDWVRYWMGWVVTITPPGAVDAVGGLCSCAVGSEDQIKNRDVVVRLGHVKFVGLGEREWREKIVEVNLIELMKERFPGGYRRWCTWGADPECEGHDRDRQEEREQEQVPADASEPDSPEEQNTPDLDHARTGILPFHFHVEESLLLVGLRSRYVDTRDCNDADPESQPGDYFFIFSLVHSLTLLHTIHIPWPRPHSSENISPYGNRPPPMPLLALSRLNSSTCIFLYHIEENYVQDYLEKRSSWQKLITYSLLSESPTGISTSTSQQTGPALAFKSAPRKDGSLAHPGMPRCALSERGELYLPIWKLDQDDKDLRTVELVELNNNRNRQDVDGGNEDSKEQKATGFDSRPQDEGAGYSLGLDLLPRFQCGGETFAVIPSGKTLPRVGTKNSKGEAPSSSPIYALEVLLSSKSPFRRLGGLLATLNKKTCSILGPRWELDPHDLVWTCVAHPNLNESNGGPLPVDSIIIHTWLSNSPSITRKRHILPIPSHRLDTGALSPYDFMQAVEWAENGSSQSASAQSPILWGYHVRHSRGTYTRNFILQTDRVFVLPYISDDDEWIETGYGFTKEMLGSSDGEESLLMESISTHFGCRWQWGDDGLMCLEADGWWGTRESKDGSSIVPVWMVCWEEEWGVVNSEPAYTRS